MEKTWWNTVLTSCLLQTAEQYRRFYPEFAGGAEVSGMLMARAMSRDNDVTVAAFSDDIEDSIREVNGLRVHYMQRPVPNVTFSYPTVSIPATDIPLIPNFVKYQMDARFCFNRFSDILERVQPDIIHATNIAPLLLAYLTSQRMDIPYVVHLRSYRYKCVFARMKHDICDRCDYRCLPRGSRWIMRQLYQKPVRQALRSADRLIAITPWIQECYEEEGFSDIDVACNPISFAVDPVFDPSEKEKQFFFAGRITSRKGINELVEGFKIFSEYHPEWTLKVAGPGNFRYQHDNIVYMGVLSHEETLREMRRSRFCVCPSKFAEPFGRVAAEAQSVGSLVIGSRRGGMTELVKHGISTTVDSTEIARAMKKAVALSRDMYIDAVRSAYRFICQQFKRDIIRQRLQNIYEYIVV
jgi:glycosyltransferase involved in cell wall biosynthesis